MMFRRIVPFIVLMGFQIQATACYLPLHFGPYISLDFAQAITQDFQAAIKKDLGCDMDLRSADSLEDYYKTILKDKPALIVLGEYDAPLFERRGYKGLMTANDFIQAYLVVNPNRIRNKMDFKNKRVLTPSKYDDTHTFSTLYFNNHKALHTITFIEVDNISESIERFLNQDIDAVFTENFIFDRLPEFIRNRFEILERSDFLAVTIMIHESIDQSLQKQLVKYTPTINFIPFKPHITYKKTSPHTDILNDLILELESK